MNLIPSLQEQGGLGTKPMGTEIISTQQVNSYSYLISLTDCCNSLWVFRSESTSCLCITDPTPPVCCTGGAPPPPTDAADAAWTDDIRERVLSCRPTISSNLLPSILVSHGRERQITITILTPILKYKLYIIIQLLTSIYFIDMILL